MKERFSLKDHLFNPEKVAFLANSIANIYPDFDSAGFQKEVVEAFPALELKKRIAHIRTCLKKYLPSDYKAATTVILKALPPPLNEDLTDNDFGDFIFAPFSDFVAQYGCTEAHLHFSLSALREITKRFSAEDAIRYFLNAFPKETLAALQEWTSDANYHVRRLCSEGTRPKLPWSQKINIYATEALPLLHLLYADKTRYVTRSVANHLNDIAKTHPQWVLNTLKHWQESGKQSDTEMQFIKKHALRTLIKDGHPEALSLLGFGDSLHITISDLIFTEQVKIGEALTFSFTLATQESKALVVDYILYFQSKQGTLSNKKVFKLQALNTVKNVPITLQKRHVFKPDMTTRQLYAGTHKVDIQVNGKVISEFSFELIQ
jgi:3-methyladenine DNA glycosylase AlkC